MGLTLSGVLALLVVTFFVTYLGFLISEREGDARGIIGWALGACTLGAGLAWMLGV